MLERQFITDSTQCMVAELQVRVSDAMQYDFRHSPNKAAEIEGAWARTQIFLSGVMQGIEKTRSGNKLPNITLAHIPENVFRDLVFLISNVPGAKKLLIGDPRIEQPFDMTGFNVIFLALQNSLRIHKKPGNIDPRTIALCANRIARLEGADISMPEIEKSEPFPVQTDQIAFDDIKHGAVALHDVLDSLKLSLSNEFEKEKYDIIDTFLIGVLSTEKDPPRSIAATYTLEDVPEAVCDAIAFLQGQYEDFHLAVLGYDVLIDGEVSYDKHGRRQSYLQNPLATNPINVAVLNTQKRLQNGSGTVDEQIRFDLLTETRSHKISVGIIVADARARLENLLVEAARPNGARENILVRVMGAAMGTVAEWWGGVRERQRQKSRDKTIQRWIKVILETAVNPMAYPSHFHGTMTTISQIFQEGEKHPDILTRDLLEGIHFGLECYAINIDPEYCDTMNKDVARAQSVQEYVHVLKKHHKYILSARSDLYTFPEFPRSVKFGTNYESTFIKKLSSKVAWVQHLPDGRLVICSDKIYIVNLADNTTTEMDIDVSGTKQMRCTEYPHQWLFLDENDRRQRIVTPYNASEGGMFDYPVPAELKMRTIWRLQEEETRTRTGGWSGAYHGVPEMDERIDTSYGRKGIGVGQNVHAFYVLSDSVVAAIIENQDGTTSVSFDAGDDRTMSVKVPCHVFPGDVEILPGDYLVARREGKMSIFKIDIRKKDCMLDTVNLSFIKHVAVNDEKPFTMDNGITAPPREYPYIPSKLFTPIPPGSVPLLPLLPPFPFLHRWLFYIGPKRHFVTSTQQGEILIYDIERRMTIEKFKAHNGPVFHIQILPNGTIISAGQDGCVVVSKPKQLR